MTKCECKNCDSYASLIRENLFYCAKHYWELFCEKVA